MRVRDERGAVAVMMVPIVALIVLIAAFAVDLGMQRVVRSDMQALADVVALDASRLLDGRTAGQIRDGFGDPLPLADVVSASVRRNVCQPTEEDACGSRKWDVDDSDVTAVLVFTEVNDLGAVVPRRGANGALVSVSNGEMPDAVLIEASGSVKFAFAPGSGSATRSALGAQSELSACMVMDSYAAALRSDGSTVLGPIARILGTSVDTGVLSSSGILTTDLSVLDFLNVLKTQLNVGTTDEVLSANITPAQLMQAQATALTQQGAAAAAISALNSQITTKLGPLANRQPGINVGELLGITQGGASALGTTVNAFDLAAAGVQLANGTNPVAASLSVPAGLTGASTVNVTVGSRPMRVCLGEGKKTMGQTSVTATVNLLSPGSLTGNLVTSLTDTLNAVLCGTVGAILGADCFGVPTVSLGPLTATVSLAAASGEVLGLSCTGATPDSLSVREAASLAPVSVTIPLTISQTRTFGSIFNRKTETVTSTFTITATTDTVDKSVTATLNVPADYDTGKPGPSGDLSIPSLIFSTSMVTNGKFSNGSETSLIGGTLAALSTVLNSVSTQLLTPLLSTAVSPLVTALTNTLKSAVGLTIAGSTYTPLRTPGCETRSLVG